MKYCTECGSENKDDVKFCIECANEFPEQKKEKKGFAELMNGKGSKFAIIGACSLFVILVVFFVGKSIYLNANPVLKVLNGVDYIAKKKEFEGQAALNVKINDNSDEAEFVEDFGLLVDFDLSRDDLSTKYTVMLEENDVFETVVAVKENTLYVDFLDYYDEVFYYENDEINEQADALKSLMKYVDTFKLKGVDRSKYIEAIQKSLKRDVKTEGGRVIVDMNVKDMLEVVEAVLDEAEDDEELMLSLHTELVDILTSMLEDDFEYVYDEDGYSEFKLDDNTIEIALDAIEDFEDFTDLYEMAIDEMVSDLRYQLQFTQEDVSLELVFDFNVFNKIKTVEATFDFEEGKIFTKLDLSKSNKFKRYSITKSTAIEDVIDDNDIVDVIEDIGDNFIDKFVENEENVDYVEDSDVFKSYSEDYRSADCEDFLEEFWKELMYEASYMF